MKIVILCMKIEPYFVFTFVFEKEDLAEIKALDASKAIQKMIFLLKSLR